jgi:adenine-specific DNA-methyltransferase
MRTAVLFNFDGDENNCYSETDNKDYLNNQVVMYSQRKQSLLNFIDVEVMSIKKRLGKNKISVLDGFSGTGIVSRLFKKHSNKLYSNDLEYYSMIINQCYLTNRNTVDYEILTELVDELNAMSILEHESGFIEELYSPKITHDIKIGEKAFFTNENAKIIDNIRRDIDIIAEPEYHSLLIAPLLASLKDKSNVMQVYRAFYKDTSTNKGQWGGNNPKLTSKLFNRIFLEVPVLSDFNCESVSFCRDINVLVRELPEVDLAYFDPPCDGYAFGENYFMYNLIAKYERPVEVTKEVSVPLNWNRSAYNSKRESKLALIDLVENTKAKYIMLTYNENGLLSIPELTTILEQFGKVEIKSIKKNNSTVVYLFTLEKTSKTTNF